MVIKQIIETVIFIGVLTIPILAVLNGIVQERKKFKKRKKKEGIKWQV